MSECKLCGGYLHDPHPSDPRICDSCFTAKRHGYSGLRDDRRSKDYKDTGYLYRDEPDPWQENAISQMEDM